MPKKKASNRLKKIFDGVTPEETLALPKQSVKKTRPILEETPQLPVPSDLPKTKPLNSNNLPTSTKAERKTDPNKSKQLKPTSDRAENNTSVETITESVSEGGSILSFAFQAKEDNWSILRVVDEPTRQWTDDEQLLIKQVTDQLSLALENAYLFQDSQRRANEMTALAQIGREISSTLNTEAILQKISEHAHKLLQAASAAIYIPNEEITLLQPIATTGEEAQEIKDDPLTIGKGVIGSIAANRVGEIINNVNEDSRAITIKGTETTTIEHLMVMPILTQDTLRGVIAVWREGDEQEFVTTEFDFLSSLAQQAAVTIENARLFEEETRRSAELQAVSEISSALSTILNEQRLLEEFVYLTRKRFNLYHTHIFMLEEDKITLSVRACGWLEEEKKGTQDSHSININQQVSLVAKAARTHQTVIQNNVREDPTWLANPELPYVKSEMAVPVFSQEKLLGILNVHSERGQAFSDSDAAIMTTLATQIGAVIQNTRLFQQIRSSQSQLSEALKIARLGYSESDPKSALMTLTDELYALLETNSEKEGGYTHSFEHVLKVFVFPEDEPKARTAMRDAIASTDAAEIAAEIRFVTRSEKIIWVRTIYKAERDAAGNPIKVISSAQDITERKIAEDAIQRRNQYLATSAEISRIVTSTLDLDTIFARTVNLVAERFNLYHAAIFTTDETKFNASFREGTGMAGEAMKTGKFSVQVNDRNIIGSVIWNGEALVIDDVSADPRYKPNELLSETRSEAGIPLRIGNRTIGVLDIQSTQLSAFNENDLAVLQTLADQVAIAIDNARSYEISQQAVLEMRETDRVKSQFLANMSHELRTPLNSIIGFSRVILKGIDGPVTELQQQDLTAIYNSGQHLLALINDILDLSKIEAGKMELAFDDVNIVDLINGVLSTISGYTKDKPITIKKITPTDLPIIRADAIRLRQVMLNLLSNAAKFTDEGEIKVEAKIIVEQETGRQEVMVSVTDSGPGISPEDQKKLFQAFSQVDDSPTRKTGGTGLGLSISDRLVQMHGGRIGVNSAVGKGSTFFFTVPAPQVKEQKTDDDSGVKVILAIDDDEKVISLYERYLQPQGYQVVSVTDPAKAKEKAIQIKPFAITLDIMMPNIDGWQVLSELKADPATRDIPIVICSIIEDHKKGFSLGASDYLAKPILEEDLLDALDRLNADGSIKEVLVIDDDPNDLRLIGKMLNDQGRYKSILAEGGPQGWQMIQASPPQAVILDLFMPEMDGLSIIENMRSDDKLRDVPVIMITGADLSPEQRENMNKMGQVLLNKGSFTPNELLGTIERALHRIQKKKKATS